jgi:hypothetical protein
MQIGQGGGTAHAPIFLFFFGMFLKTVSATFLLSLAPPWKPIALFRIEDRMPKSRMGLPLFFRGPYSVNDRVNNFV